MSGFASRRRQAAALLLLSLAAHISAQTAAYPRKTWMNDDSIERKIDMMMGSMSDEEKVGQMLQVESANANPQALKENKLGSILSGGGDFPSRLPYRNTPQAWRDLYDSYQNASLETPKRIPFIYGIDSVHGHNKVNGSTVFPHNIGIGATRNKTVAWNLGYVTAREMAATGLNWVFGPCIAVARDDRWGRTYESFGEDPSIHNEFTGPLIEAMQGQQIPIAATAKHFAADGGTRWNTSDGKDGYRFIDRGDTGMLLSDSALRAIHLNHYTKAIQAGVMTVMASFNKWRGVDMHENTALLTTWLKNEQQFKGMVVTDWDGIDDVTGATYHNKIVTAINAGIDMLMVPGYREDFPGTTTPLHSTWMDAQRELLAAVRGNEIKADRFNDAVRRILRVKYALNLFDEPFKYKQLLVEVFGSKEHREMARDAVRQSLVLLKNEDGILPLKKSASVLVCGRNAENVANQMGGWTIDWQGMGGRGGNIFANATSILQGFRQVIGKDGVVDYSEDCRSASRDVYDVAVAVIGENAYAEWFGDSATLALSAEDEEALDVLRNASMPTVAVLISGRPLIITNTIRKVDAFVAAWLPGSEGAGVADVLFGDYDFRGKLPVTWPLSVANEPINVGDANVNTGALFQFGFGLSYGACVARPCKNNGRCIASTTSATSYTCQCRRGFASTTAQPDCGSVDAFVNQLFNQMTFQEKIGQMLQIESPNVGLDEIRSLSIGSILSGGGDFVSNTPYVNNPAAWRVKIDRIQQAALRNRLNIPFIYGVDAVHGNGKINGSTVFPHHVGIGASRDPQVARNLGYVTAREASACGFHWVFAPCIAVARDERWGRSYESFGEDPEIQNALTRPLVEALQGQAVPIAASAKHFAGDGGTKYGTGENDMNNPLDRGDTQGLDEQLRAIHLEHYKQALAAGVLTVMASFNRWNGVDMHENTALLTDWLKVQNQFKGIIVTDWDGADGVSGDKYIDKIRVSLRAGIDMFMVPGWAVEQPKGTLLHQNWTDARNALLTIWQRNEGTDQARINDAVRRILYVKAMLGLFDTDKPSKPAAVTRSFGSAEHRAMARDAVRKSLVLLKNDGVLPLKKTASVLVCGRNANNMQRQMGGWTIDWQGMNGRGGGVFANATTILQGIEQAVNNSGWVQFKEDCSIADKLKHDVIVAVVGEDAYSEWFGDVTQGSSVSLVPADVTALNNAKASEIPTAVVVVSGRPVEITSRLNDIGALVAAWLPGSEGAGVADVLFGDYDFTGVLPVTWPRQTSDEPVNKGDVDAASKALFPYGFGLKYEGCISHPCQHGGKCTPGSFGQFSCVCTNNFQGPKCTDVEAFVAATVAQMTPEEKFGQTLQIESPNVKLDEVRQYSIGSILSGGGDFVTSVPYVNDPVSWRAKVDMLQKYALLGSKHIPIMYGVDSVHGVNKVNGSTVFPHNIGIGASRDPQVAYNVGYVTAREMAAVGLHWVFGPCIAVARDDRWGRTYESFGEHPQIHEQLITPLIRAMQEQAVPIAATAKHFAGDGSTEWGSGDRADNYRFIDRGDSTRQSADEATWRALHLNHYITALRAGALTVMASFNRRNGVDMHENSVLLTDWLKTQQGFQGVVVTDWDGIDDIQGDNYVQKIVRSVNAGIDMLMVPGYPVDFTNAQGQTVRLHTTWNDALEGLKQAVSSGQVSMDRINDAVKRIIRVKKLLGLFEHPYSSRSPAVINSFGSATHRAMARDAVRKSLVLLKNEASVLPLRKTATVAVVGRNAHNIKNQMGGWTIDWQGMTEKFGTKFAGATTIFEGLKQVAGAEGNVTLDVTGASLVGLPVKPDVIVAVVGEDAYAEWFGDNNTLALNVNDTLALDNALRTGVPVVMVVVSGRPVILQNYASQCAAVVAAWLPGSEGAGVADVLYGDYDFQGRLPVSWPSAVTQEPINVGDAVYTPLYPFDFGLKYGRCITRPCQHNADCVPDDAGFTCKCKNGFEGRLCDGVDTFAAEVVKRLSKEQKIGQMLQVESPKLTIQEMATEFVGSVLSGGGDFGQPAGSAYKTEVPDSYINTLDAWRTKIEALQRSAAASLSFSPLQFKVGDADLRVDGIPFIYGIDSVHGFNKVNGSTVFPHNIGIGATRDPQVAYNLGYVTAREMAAAGIHWNFGPCIAVARDDRWGRTYESLGEDPSIHNMLVEPLIRGLQQQTIPIAATAKHFAGDGGAVWGTGDMADDKRIIDRGNARGVDAELRKLHLLHYKKALNAGVMTFMATFTLWNGVDMHENKALLTDWLKVQQGFKGMVVTDWDGVDDIVSPTATYEQKITSAINAGIDMLMVPGGEVKIKVGDTERVLHSSWKEARDALKSAIDKGRIPQSRIDDAVTRIIRVKKQLGLFDERMYPSKAESVVSAFGSAAHHAMARDAVRKSLVLLHNDGVLPIRKQSSVLVVGKNADYIPNQMGGWTIDWQGMGTFGNGVFTGATTILQGIREVVGSEGTVQYNPTGLNINQNQFDVIVVVVAENSYAEWFGDSATLALPAEEMVTLANVKSTGLPYVVVLMSGRPVDIRSWNASVNAKAAKALVAAWLPGSEGAGVADVLFGDYDFTGKLPMTWPLSVANEPVNVGDVVYNSSNVMFPFDHGLVMGSCITHPCLHGGTCHAEDGTFTCECGDYYNGTRCEQVEWWVNETLGKMTDDEKVAQMLQVESPNLTPIDLQQKGIGSVLSGGGDFAQQYKTDPPTYINDPQSWRAKYDYLQNGALLSRLRIPMIYGIDAVHGHNKVDGATVFPHNIGIGATRNATVAWNLGYVTAREMAATGLNWVFGPCIAVARDDRWGRTYESFGEDPEIHRLFTKPLIEAMQGQAVPIAATAKHFAGDGGTQWMSGDNEDGTRFIDRGNVVLDNNTFAKIHLNHYKEALEAGVLTVMASFNRLNGVDMHENYALLTQWLKNEQKFQGLVVTDWDGVDDIVGATYQDKIVNAVNAGIDMLMVPGYEAKVNGQLIHSNWQQAYDALRTAVLQGKVSPLRLNDTVRRILRVKTQLGLFDHPKAPTSPAVIQQFGTPQHRAMARDAVRQSLVLLKNTQNIRNENKGALPLNTSQRVLVTGRNANHYGRQMGGWTIDWQGIGTHGNGIFKDATTLYQGMSAKAPGKVDLFNVSGLTNITAYDVVVAFVGEDAYAEWKGDTDKLYLTEEDNKTLATAMASGIPVVVVIVSGRPLIINHIIGNASAVVAAWLPGSEGAGVADVLYGEYPFKGKLPVSWPRSVSQEPINVGDETYDPLFAYGFGLTYDSTLSEPSAAVAPVGNKSISGGVVLAIVVGCILVGILFITFCCWMCRGESSSASTDTAFVQQKNVDDTKHTQLHELQSRT